MSAVDDPQRCLVLVLGDEASGAAELAGTLATLGLRIPEADAAERTPWLRDLHRELLARADVAVDDARPSAWFATGRLAHLEPLRKRVHDWLAARFEADGPELVLHDPALVWFVGLWRSAALRAGAETSSVVLLRRPPDSAAPHAAVRASGAPDPDAVAAAASWLNLATHAEKATRGAPRAFVLRDELAADWTVPVSAVGERLGLPAVQDAEANAIRAVHSYLRDRFDRREPAELPDAVAALVDRAWEALSALAVGADDLDRLDAVRADYLAHYDAAAAFARSSIEAARRAGGAGRAPQPSNPRAADRVPHAVRAAVPPGLRRGLRSLAGRRRDRP